MTIHILYIYIGWIILHYTTPHLYVHWCVPANLLGFIISPFIAQTPHCQALRWSIFYGGEKIITMWILFGAWLYQKIVEINEKKD